MAIAFTTAPAFRTGNSNSPTVNRSSTTAGRIAICGIVIGTGTITAKPAAWTLIDVTPVFGTDELLYTYWHLTSAADPTTWSWTNSVTARWGTINFEFSGVDTTTPIDVKSKQANASSTSAATSGVDPSYIEDMLVVMAGWSNNTSTLTAPSSPATFTIPTNGQGLAAAQVGIGGAYLLRSTGAATGTVTGTLSSAVANGAQLIALKDTSSTPDVAGDTGTISVGTGTGSGTTVTATAAADSTGTISAGTATGSGTTVTGSEAVSAVGTVAPGLATGSGTLITGTAGSSTSATISAGTAAASGVEVYADDEETYAFISWVMLSLPDATPASATGTISPGTATGSGTSVAATAGQGSSGTISVHPDLASASGQTVTGIAGERAVGTIAVASAVGSGTLTTGMGGQDVTATITGADAIASGLLVIVGGDGSDTGTVSGGGATADGTSVSATDGQGTIHAVIVIRNTLVSQARITRVLTATLTE